MASAAFNPGMLREALQVWRVSSTGTDAFGAPAAGTPAQVGTVRAMVASLSSEERRREVGALGGGTEAAATHRVTLRAEPGLAVREADYLVWPTHAAGSRLLQIKAPPRETGVGGASSGALEVLCVEHDPAHLGAALASHAGGD